MYGTQAKTHKGLLLTRFENDVKMYGTQAKQVTLLHDGVFENDVKMYGTQARAVSDQTAQSLRMM